MWKPVLRFLRSRKPKTIRKSVSKNGRSPSYRPGFEMLEDRTVPSGISPLDLSQLAGQSGIINGAYFTGATSGNETKDAGTGNIESFVRTDNSPTEQGFNTDANPVPLDDKAGAWTHSIKVSDLRVVVIGGQQYYEFALDINQVSSTPLLSLDKLQISTASDGNLSTYTSDGTYGGNAVLKYDMGAGNWVALNYSFNDGSGNGLDMFLDVPVNNFAGASASDYVYLYSAFGDPTHTFTSTYTVKGNKTVTTTGGDANDGFEEWAIGKGQPLQASGVTATAIHEVSPDTADNVVNVPFGAVVHDTATVTPSFSGLPKPTGTVTYTLTGSGLVGLENDPSWTVNLADPANPIWTETVTLNPDGTVPVTDDTPELPAGSYTFQAVYSGDSNYVGTVSPLEPLTVEPAGIPAVNTQQSATSVVVGTTIYDTATVTGGTGSYDSSATVTFNLYNNPDGTGPALFTDPDEPLVNGVATSKSNPYTTTAIGTDYWVATFNGDANNLPSSSGLTEEPVTVIKATPSIVTDASAGGTVGVSISDTATVSGGYSPTGTVTFNLYAPGVDPTTGQPIFTDANEPLLSGGVAKSTSYATTAVGTYHWVATYNGNDTDNSVSSGATDEPAVTVKATPQIVTTATPNGIFYAGTTAPTLSDSAVLSGGYHETGSITFTLHVGTSTGATVYTHTVTVSGNGTYSSGTTNAESGVGTYVWTATYTGDGNNNPANDQGGSAEQVTIKDQVAKNEAATMGFWANNNGQKLLKTYTSALGNWLSSTYPNLFGNLLNADGTKVAAYFILVKNNAGGLIGNTYAQALTTALNIWVTTTNDGWNGANTTKPNSPTSASFGFQQGFGGVGLGGILYNVGNNGASFGIANNTSWTVSCLLNYLNSVTVVTSQGMFTKLPTLYFYNKGDTTLTNGANNVFNGINNLGDLT
jgi:hypothetical protein